MNLPLHIPTVRAAGTYPQPLRASIYWIVLLMRKEVSGHCRLWPDPDLVLDAVKAGIHVSAGMTSTRRTIDHRLPPLDIAPRHPEKVNRPDNPIQRKPAWIRVKAPNHPVY